jgi:hypothetical protein
MRAKSLVTAIAGLLVCAAVAKDNIEGPWGTPNGDLFGTQRPVGLSVDPLLTGLEEAWKFDTLGNGLNRTFFQTGQIVFDKDGNIYWVAGAANLASVDPDGNKRWATPIAVGAKTPGLSPIVGEERVYCLSNVDPGATMGAYRKDTGEKLWETPITADGFVNTSGLTPILYEGKLYVVTIGAGYGLAVTQFDAETGEQDWHNLIDSGVSGATDGTLTFVLNAFTDTDEHGLYFNTNNAPDQSTDKDVWGIRIGENGASMGWSAEGGKRGRSHLNYSPVTGRLYAPTWNDYGYDYAVYERETGEILDTKAVGDGHGFYDVGALAFDDVSIVAGGFGGRVWIYRDDGTGKIDPVRKFKTHEWYGEPRLFGQLFQDKDGREILLTGTNSRTDLDSSFTARVVLLDMAGAVVPSTEDGPLWVDELEVFSGTDYEDAIGGGALYADDFESYTEGDPVGSLPGWTDLSSGEPLPLPKIVQSSDGGGKVLEFDAFGNNFENQAAAEVALPESIPDFDSGDDFVVLRWRQWRPDLTDNVTTATDTQDATFQWDLSGEIYTTRNFSQHAPLTAGAWQTIEVRYNFTDDVVELFVDGNPADGLPDFLNDTSSPISTMAFYLDPTPPVTDDKVPFSEPLVEYDTGINANHAPIHRGGPLMGPDGKVYYFDTNTRFLIALQSTGPITIRGDSNCDGSVDFDDIDCFVAALIGEDAWDNCGGTPGCDYSGANDINEDGSVDFDDIDGFVECLINQGCP